MDYYEKIFNESLIHYPIEANIIPFLHTLATQRIYIEYFHLKTVCISCDELIWQMHCLDGRIK